MSTDAEFPQSFVRPWKELLQSRRDEQQDDFPNHHVNDIDSLITTSSPKSLYVGTGHSIYTRALLPAILGAKHSVQLITCYWAASPSLDAIRETFLQLASARSEANVTSPLRITIGFSSRGLFQKLFHPASRNGYVYPPSQWPKLGLPGQDVLQNAGIELTVKSLFFTPFSVMHPKFVIVDGERAFIPSCNVSWERWFEGCVEVEGDIVNRLVAFYERVWGDGKEPRQDRNLEDDIMAIAQPNMASSANGIETSATQSIAFPVSGPVPTIFLPSPHHRNPRFSLFPFLSQSNPPMTPLNAALLTLFSNAQRRITILTPNVTSWPVVEALLEALARGVDVQIRTSKGMMLIEQLVTAGTTTSWCLRKFIQRYNALLNQPRPSDPEAQSITPGNLEILYYKQLDERRDMDDEPVVSHFKMTLVDDEYLVLGSGNMDRASWWTSQEIGLLFYVPGFEGQRLWNDVLEKRTEVLFQSDHPKRLV
ncbi:phospholipase d [Fusarium albosuccineum]|uniref:Phospholipase d n=1 Tax=Fusarium albosuccineum TaxID=1237068 RepID=A0A8H4LN18_9HYPO|nr:phospholipase d [Fusarium albosuccineum]